VKNETLNQGASPRTGMNVSSSLPHDSLAASFHSSAGDVSQAITWKGCILQGSERDTLAFTLC
jgi:hypothetical protein